MVSENAKKEIKFNDVQWFRLLKASVDLGACIQAT